MQLKYALVALIAAAFTSASPLPIVEDVEVPCPNDSTLCANVPELDVNIALAESTSKLVSSVIDTASYVLGGIIAAPAPSSHVEI
ncbi:uncharacterized protein C8R40DRAFT_1176428 [Lentinula edodes]|uniref:uncharacterized protein n=1 Tax=Lentinula edodes TaxID=5353 RepID=UPI001E8CCF71|nr:uncharacterized protein C8R40DRAFT_1176428 [Lentinula edodes]KAH7869720.1 hypothetical protein C8R40DRAFT_1176428 [Lentinula edodes]